MAELKTVRNNASVGDFLNKVEDEQRRADCFALLELLKDVTGCAPEMWGDSIVGFGSYRYRYESGREGDWPLTGFSPRKQNLTLYIMSGFSRYEDLLKRLGRHKTGKSCLYVTRLSDLDLAVLTQLVQESIEFLRRKYA